MLRYVGVNNWNGKPSFCGKTNCVLYFQREYRDRAKERRDKFGIDDTPEFSKKKLEKMKEPIESVSAEALPITDDNLGSKMLKAMGWTEGSGLGKSNQGTADIIQVERRKGGLGLGNNNATFTRK